MNRFWYSAMLYLAFPLIILYLIIRAVKSPDYRVRWKERFGFASLKATDVLVHTASMGETIAALPLIRKILASAPDIKVTITTTSPTGSAQVIKAFGDKVQHVYLPVDVSYCVKRFLGQLQPKKVVILETELWPNLLHFAKQCGAKTFISNARLSEKSAANYQKWPKLTKSILSSIDIIAVQTEAEQQRFIELGFDASNIHVSGSLKFDVTVSEELIERGQKLRAEWQKLGAPVWIAGSVHPGEFAQVLEAHQQLLVHHPDALLIMVPRHPEKFELAAEKIQSSGLVMSRRSTGDHVDANTQVLLGDTMGEMMLFFATADQAYIGGSMIEHGGQNPLEAAAVGLALVMGESRYNFTDICQLLTDSGAMVKCSDDKTLSLHLNDGFTDPQLLKQRQKQAQSVVLANKGAVEKQFTMFRLI
ncbi:3-deoxy-D-manno-octulosonic acid transferase [Shewanella sp. OPT22]|nr:3-deoxy-D-manno-octulosonic acid transferase [Shewanella sp. OPT22]